MATDTNVNLLSPGETPYENAQFLLFLCAVIQAVDDYQDLLRIAVASAGNDHRLGANEAPPAVVSIFLGDELNAVLEALETDTPYEGIEKIQMKLGVDVLPGTRPIGTAPPPLPLQAINLSSVWLVPRTVFLAPTLC